MLGAQPCRSWFGFWYNTINNFQGCPAHTRRCQSLWQTAEDQAHGAKAHHVVLRNDVRGTLGEVEGDTGLVTAEVVGVEDELPAPQLLRLSC